MKIGNQSGRLVVVTDTGLLDVERASEGRFSSDPQAIYDRWPDFLAWARSAPLDELSPLDTAKLGAPTPSPSQIFAIGLNYRDHAAESGFDAPDAQPPVFTKFASSITGAYGEIELPPGGHTDWEVELVAVIGLRAYQVAEQRAWDHVAGLSVGQDISERILQMASPSPQFSLGKSYPGFSPIGPWLVTPDELENRDSLRLGCSINGETVQDGSTRQLIFSVPQLIAKLSAVLPLSPGDVIFTGTPAGVGLGRTPQRWLQPGDELVSFIEGIGELRHRFI
jgi:2-keto-4-pentenoate hydratase/2-oxohepta-3-ene-1,7-dioic acid hydratase in catechol pathway